MKGFRKEIRECEQIPNFYGLSYWEPCTRIAVCYPIPFNIIFAVYKFIIWKIKAGFGLKTGQEIIYKNAHVHGEAVGHQVGYQQGFKEGWDAYYNHFQALIEERRKEILRPK